MWHSTLLGADPHTKSSVEEPRLVALVTETGRDALNYFDVPMYVGFLARMIMAGLSSGYDKREPKGYQATHDSSKPR